MLTSHQSPVSSAIGFLHLTKVNLLIIELNLHLRFCRRAVRRQSRGGWLTDASMGSLACQ
jgi:hypothetical protein